MGILKSTVAFILGYIALALLYTYVAIPIFPIISINIAAFFLLEARGLRTRRVLVFLLGCIAITYYSANIYASIIYYPDYSTIFGMIFDGITIVAFIGSMIICIKSITDEIYEMQVRQQPTHDYIDME